MTADLSRDWNELQLLPVNDFPPDRGDRERAASGRKNGVRIVHPARYGGELMDFFF